MSELRSQVGNLVRHYRECAGVTQAQLAEKIDKSVQLVGRIERGASAPSFETMEAMALALGIEVRDLFGLGSFAVGATATNDPLARLVQRCSELDPLDQEWLLKLVNVALARKPGRRVA